MRAFWFAFYVMAGALAGWNAPLGAEDYFAIRVVDGQTGRGVPLIELRGLNRVSYYTDSEGWIAFYEPGLMDTDVFFEVSGPGYRFEDSFFDWRGTVLHTEPGGQATLAVTRHNVAERLYRITGSGIYRDTVLLGKQPPIENANLNGRVMGQDTVIAAPYRDQLYWFWGDTFGAAGLNFSVSGATSPLPGRLDVAEGIPLTYFERDSGLAKEMCPFGSGMTWIDWLAVLGQGADERLYARYSRMQSLGEAAEWGYAVFDDERAVFDKVAEIAVRPDVQQHYSQHPFHARVAGDAYIYLPTTLCRFRAERGHLLDPSQYAYFTCLEAGARFDAQNPALVRDGQGRLVYDWKQDTDAIGFARQRALIENGLMKREEALFQLRDVETGAWIEPYPGSVFWNEFRQRWILFTQGAPGTVYYSEAQTPMGPWAHAVKIISHENYNFYNVTQHPFFDHEDGRVIFFEGTYVNTFTDNPEKTPWYDYNQILYRLALDDPALQLPDSGPVLEKHAGQHGYVIEDGGMVAPELGAVEMVRLVPAE